MPSKPDRELVVIPTFSGAPVLAVRLGRGRTGGSTFLDFLIQRANAAGRTVLIADGDKRNSTLSNLYDGASLQPKNDEIPTVKDWVSSVLDRMATTRTSVALDLGGGDRVMAEYGRDLELVQFCESIGALPLALYFLGPDPDDLDHVNTLYESGVFRPQHTILIFNGHLIKTGQTVETAFAKTLMHPNYRKILSSGAQQIFVPNLPCLDKVRELKLSLQSAANDSDQLGPTASFMVRRWLARLEEECAHANVLEWLP